MHMMEAAPAAMVLRPRKVPPPPPPEPVDSMAEEGGATRQKMQHSRRKRYIKEAHKRESVRERYACLSNELSAKREVSTTYRPQRAGEDPGSGPFGLLRCLKEE